MPFEDHWLSIQEKNCRKRQRKCGAAITCTRSWGVLKGHKQKVLNKSDSDTANISFPLSSLPEHILFIILTFLPARVLHNVAIYVCRSWYRLVKDPIFIRDNLLRSSFSLSFNAHAWCQIPSELHLQISNHSHGSKLQITSSALPLCFQVLATCNGLILARNSSNSKYSLYLVNPVTGENISNFPLLPIMPSPYGPPCTRLPSIPKPAIGIAYIPFLDTYKVVLFPRLSKQPVFVLTLGTDTAWRFVDTTTAKIRGRLRLHVSCLGVAEFEGLSNVQIWALTNVELREWTKMFTIATQIDTLFQSFSDAFNNYDHLRKAQLIHCSTSGEVTLVYFSTTSMVLYWRDVRTGAYEAIVHDKPLEGLYFYSRVESLISPKSIAVSKAP